MLLDVKQHSQEVLRLEVGTPKHTLLEDALLDDRSSRLEVKDVRTRLILASHTVSKTYLLVMLRLERHRAAIYDRRLREVSRLEACQRPLMLKRMGSGHHQKFIVLPKFDLWLLGLRWYHFLLAPHHVALLELLKFVILHHKLAFRLTISNLR